MVKASQERQIWATLVIYILLITLPYIFGAMQSDNIKVFGGFLLNPIDGHSYLAKMYQGLRGDIQFHLPFTASEGNGSYLFLFYIFLGHFSRIFHLDNIVTFHVFRILGALFLGWVFIKKLVFPFPDDSLRLPLTIVGLIGLGSGWLAFLMGQLSPDTWVAEAYPFLAGYSNPHFPFGLGLMILLLFPEDNIRSKTTILNGLLAIILAIMLPFAIILVIGIWFIQILLIWALRIEWSYIKVKIYYGFILVITAGPILLYDFWVARVDPLLQGWDAQNLTPSPPIQLVFLGLLPICLFILIIKPTKMVNFETSRTMFVWLCISLILLYAPIGLQRRMMTGIFIPAVWLGFWGIAQISSERRKRRIGILVIGLSMVTPLIVVMAGLAGSKQQSSEIFLWKDEVTAFNWIEKNTPENALVLTGPETGLYLPAYTGRKVFYGHPFETVNAQKQLAWVNHQMQQFADGETSAFPEEIDLVFWGPRETTQFGSVAKSHLRVVFENDHVTLYAPDRE